MVAHDTGLSALETMKTKILFWNKLAIMMMAVAGLAFTSCSEDDDEEATENVDYSTVISGSWYVDIDDEESCELIIDFKGQGNIYFTDLINQDEGVTAKGTYTLSGNQIFAIYNDVSVYTERGSSTFNGFTDGKKKTMTYTIVSCNDRKMVLKTSDGNTLNFEKTQDSKSARALTGTIWSKLNDNGDQLTLCFPTGSAGNWVAKYAESIVKQFDEGNLTYSVEASDNGLKGVVSISYADGVVEALPFTVAGSKMIIFDNGGNAIWELAEQQD